MFSKILLINDFNSEKSPNKLSCNHLFTSERLVEAGLSHIFEGIRGNYRVVTDKVDCDVYQLDELLKKEQFKRKEDFHLLEQLVQKDIWRETDMTGLTQELLNLMICSIG